MMWLFKILIKLAVLAMIVLYAVHFYHTAMNRGEQFVGQLESSINDTLHQQRVADEADQVPGQPPLTRIITKLFTKLFGTKQRQQPQAVVVDPGPAYYAPTPAEPQPQREGAAGEDRETTERQQPVQQEGQEQGSVQNYYNDAPRVTEQQQTNQNNSAYAETRSSEK